MKRREPKQWTLWSTEHNAAPLPKQAPQVCIYCKKSTALSAVQEANPSLMARPIPEFFGHCLQNAVVKLHLHARFFLGNLPTNIHVLHPWYVLPVTTVYRTYTKSLGFLIIICAIRADQPPTVTRHARLTAWANMLMERTFRHCHRLAVGSG